MHLFFRKSQLICCNVQTKTREIKCNRLTLTDFVGCAWFAGSNAYCNQLLPKNILLCRQGMCIHIFW